MNAPTLTTLACLLAPLTQAQTETNLVPSDSAIFGYYGRSVAVDGTRAVVGSTGAVTGGTATGAVYVFDPATGQQIQRLHVTDAENGRFGGAVAVEGNRIFVSAFLRNDIGPTPATFLTQAGGVYVFDATTGQQLDFILPGDVQQHIHFGRALAVQGGLMAVGARAATGFGVEPDTVYIFDAGTGQELHKLLASDGEDEDGLGEAVSIDGGLVVSGAAGDDDNGFRSGSAYLFNAVTGAELFKLTPHDAAAGDSFGTSVAIQGSRIVVGAPRDEDNGPSSGSAYVFDALTGQQLMKLVPGDGQTGDTFGQTVAIEGGRVLVSAPQSDDGANRSGSVYEFDLATGQELSKLTAGNGGDDHYFGYSLAAHRDYMIVGSPFASLAQSTDGTATLIDLDGGPGGVMSYCDPLGANTVSDSGALLSSTGGFGTSAATFNISGVPNNFGLLFAGDAQAMAPLGCGTRCVGGNIVRGPILQAQNGQVLGATFDMAQFGSTHIQYWFREGGSCTGGNNLSNALTR